MNGGATCPVCRAHLNDPYKWEILGPNQLIRCTNCGPRLFEWRALALLTEGPFDEQTLARLAHALYGRRPDLPVSAELLTELVRDAKLPRPIEVIDKILMLMATREIPTSLQARYVSAAIGTANAEQSKWALSEAIREGLIAGTSPYDPQTPGVSWTLSDAALTIKGWRRHEELMRLAVDSKRAFMAMDYSDAGLWDIVNHHMKRAVEETGFQLHTTADLDVARAGNIVDRMLVEIRTSRFLICDVTHGNRGAYWEAGFASGLGRPVIYTCRSNVMDNADGLHPDRPHFDIAQSLTVKWDPDNLGPAMEQLKAVIRNTLHHDAKVKMTDP